MHHVHSFFTADRYSAKKMAKPINFVCVAPEASHPFSFRRSAYWDSGLCTGLKTD